MAGEGTIAPVAAQSGGHGEPGEWWLVTVNWWQSDLTLTARERLLFSRWWVGRATIRGWEVAGKWSRVVASRLEEAWGPADLGCTGGMSKTDTWATCQCLLSG